VRDTGSPQSTSAPGVAQAHPSFGTSQAAAAWVRLTLPPNSYPGRLLRSEQAKAPMTKTPNARARCTTLEQIVGMAKSRILAHRRSIKSLAIQWWADLRLDGRKTKGKLSRFPATRALHSPQSRLRSPVACEWLSWCRTRRQNPRLISKTCQDARGEAPQSFRLAAHRPSDRIEATGPQTSRPARASATRTKSKTPPHTTRRATDTWHFTRCYVVKAGRCFPRMVEHLLSLSPESIRNATRHR
jgi:hypothetical protein